MLVPAAHFVRVFCTEYSSFTSSRGHVDTAAARARVPGLRDVSWRGPAGAVRGWFVPGTAPAAVVLLHGSGGNRAELLPELEILSTRGFSVLAFDWPGQGESAGRTRWDETERATLGSAIDWLSSRSEVDAGRIGAFGFSVGGYPLIQRAVVDARIRAVAVAGTPGDATEYARWQYRAFGPLPQLPALLAMRASGMHPRRQVPVRLVRQLAPRPLLVILGERDRTVPPAMVRALYEAAGQPKEPLVIPAAGHGDYARVAPGRYTRRLTSFFAHALLDDRPVGGTKTE
jgi:fermentation-respiration switch protein FrsA (DUF1100 family)